MFALYGQNILRGSSLTFYSGEAARHIYRLKIRSR